MFESLPLYLHCHLLEVHFTRLRRYEGLALKSISISCLLNAALGRIQYRHPQARNSLCNILSVTLGWHIYHIVLEEESASQITVIDS